MTDCAEELLPMLLHVFFVGECGQMTSEPAGCLSKTEEFYYYSYPAGMNHAIYPGDKLRCSKPHELILAWDKSGITRDNFIPAIEQPG